MAEESDEKSDWSLEEARNNLETVFEQARNWSVQRIVHNGRAVIDLNETRYKIQIGEKVDYIEFLMNGPQIPDFEIPPRDSYG